MRHRPDQSLLFVAALAASAIAVATPARSCDPTARGGGASPGTASLGAPTGGPEAAAAGWSHLISVSSNNYNPDCNPWVTADGTKLFFITWDDLNGPPRPGFQGEWDIYESQWNAALGQWDPAVNVGPPINTPAPERRPSATASGDTLFFERAGNVWVSIRSGGSWGAPVSLFQGSDPCITVDGLQIYFVRNGDIWVADRGASMYQWSNLRSVGAPVNTTYSEVRPFISFDKTKLYFSDFGQSRPGGYGAADLWVSTWTGTGWGVPVNVGPPVNTDRGTCTPYLSFDERSLYTSSESFEGSRGDEDVWVAFLDSVPAPAEVVAGPGAWTKCGELAGAWNVYDLAEGPDGALYAATSPQGIVYRSEDGGESWTALPALPGARIIYSLLMGSGGVLYAGTYPQGDVFRSTDRGDSWQATANLAGATTVRALLETSDGRILAGTSQGGVVFSSTDGGLSWATLATLPGIRSGVTCLFQSRSGRLHAGGWGPPYRSTDGGATWTSTTNFPFPPSEARSIDSFYETRDSTLCATGWVHGHGGYVFRSTDGGSAWDTTGTIMIGAVHAVRVYAMDEDDGGNLRIGYQPGPDSVACRSRDRGATWEVEGALPGAHEILAFLRTVGGVLYAATTPNGDVFRWTGGATDVPVAAGPASVDGFFLRPAEPNPSRSSVTLAYRLETAGETVLRVIDSQGRHVRTLFRGSRPAGEGWLSWDTRDDAGRPVASGVYLARLESAGVARSCKLVVAR